jgi:hypothetical protein
MKRQHRQYRQPKTPHAVLAVSPLRFADLIDEVSKLAASPTEAAQVIEGMLRRRAIRFADGFDSRQLSL